MLTPHDSKRKTAGRWFYGLAVFFVLPLLAITLSGFVPPSAHAKSAIVLKKKKIVEKKTAPQPIKDKEVQLQPVKESPGKASVASSEIEFLRNEAKDARAFAEKQRKHAKQWQDRASEARKRAKNSKRKIDRDSYLDDARIYDERAETAAIDADKAEAKAAKSEAELLQVLKTLERGPSKEVTDTPPAKSATKDDMPKPPAISLAETIGLWRIKETDSTFVIVQEEPGLDIHGYKLEAHTGDRVWKGEYSVFEEGDIRRSQNARVVFKYKPKAKEMNPEIPEWARKKIEGQLEWQIELDEAGFCGDPYLKGYLFPGEVKWSKDKEGGPVKITDRGKPRPIELERGYHFELDMVGKPSLVVTMGGKHDPLLNPIEGLTKRQRFFVKMTLPKEMAKKQGETLTVTIKGLSSGETDTLTLKAGGFSKSKASVNYTHLKAVTIADSNDPREEDHKATFLSWSWWTDSADGARLDLDVENGEGIEFGFNDMFETIPVYDSWLQRNIARYEAGAWRLRGFFEFVRDSLNPEVTGEAKKKARDGLQMLENMQAMLDTGYLSDVHKHELLKAYVVDGRVNNSPGGLDLAAQQMQMSPTFYDEVHESKMGLKIIKGFSEGLTGKDLSSKMPLVINAVGTGWVSSGEKFLAKRTLKKASKSIQEQAFDELVPALAYGLYDGVVLTSGAGELYLIATGYDHFDKKRSWQDRMLTAVGLGSGIILNIHGGTAWQRFSNRNIGVTLGGKGSPVKFHMNRLGAPVKTPRVWRGDFKPLYPESIRPAQRAQVNLKPPPGYKAPKKGSGTGTARAPGATRSGQAKPKYDPEVDQFIRDVDMVDAFYGPNGDILDAFEGRVFKRQCYQNCNIVADNYVQAINGKKPKTGVDALIQMKKADLLDEHGLYKGKNIMQQGAPNQLSKDYNALNEFQTIDLPPATNAGRTVKEIDMVQKGLKADNVKVAIAVGNLDEIKAIRKTGSYKGIDYHAVVIHDVIRDADGVITKVQFFDPAVGRIVELPACQFNQRLAKHADYGNATVYFAPTKNKPTIEWPKGKKSKTAGTGADAPGSGKKPKKHIKVDEFDDLPKKPIKVDEFDPFEDMDVHESIDYLYPGGKGAPRINVVETEIHEGLKKGTKREWRQPKKGGASFSGENMGTGYGGDVAIRVKKDFAKKHIEWRLDEQGRGQVPIYWPEGKRPDGTGIGKHKTYIPRDQLEYLDPSQPGEPKWRDYEPLKGQ
jgi:hypothetical protein